MTIDLSAELTIDARNVIGEAPGWDLPGNRFIWSDNERGVIHEARLDSQGTLTESGRWHVGRNIAGAIVRENGGFIVAGGTEVFMLDERGRSTLLARLDADPARVRLSSIKCDSRGRLWVGTLATDLSQGCGALYRIDADGSIFPIIENASLSHGLGWSPDGLTFYHIDSPTRLIDAFDYDAVHATVSNRRTIIEIEEGSGLPDGLTIDCDGCLWIAIFGAGEIRRYAPDGTPLERVKVPVRAVTNCAFGGPNGTDLFITSAGKRLPAALSNYGISNEILNAAHLALGAGGVFTCRPGARGSPATRFSG
jgi:sugar lactone lactonase YvrE